MPDRFQIEENVASFRALKDARPIFTECFAMSMRCSCDLVIDLLLESQ